MDRAKCDDEVFSQGVPVLLIDGRSAAVERWVAAVAAQATARLDWHYSGGVAQVLHLGDDAARARVEAAIDALADTLDGGILQRLEPGAPGLFRAGVSESPAGSTFVFYEGGSSSTFA